MWLLLLHWALPEVELLAAAATATEAGNIRSESDGIRPKTLGFLQERDARQSFHGNRKKKLIYKTVLDCF